MSNIGLYYRRAQSSVTDLSIPASQELAQLYNYQFVDGVLTINRMPITIAPRDTTLTYGQAMKGRDMKFNYTFDASAVPVNEQSAFLDSIKTTHLATMSNAVLLINTRQAVNGQNLTEADFNMSFMASGNASVNTQGRLLIHARL